MEAIQSGQFTLKQILQQNWCSFLDVYHLLVQWYAAYNVWKVLNCREPDGLGYATFACPVHPSEIYHIPRSYKSRFCSVCAKVQISGFSQTWQPQFLSIFFSTDRFGDAQGQGEIEGFTPKPRLAKGYLQYYKPAAVFLRMIMKAL